MANVIFQAYDLPTFDSIAGTQIIAKTEDGQMGYVQTSQLQTTLDGNGLATDAELQALSASVAGVFDGTGVGVFSTVQANINGTGTNFKVGDDAYIGDMNQPNTMIVSGQQERTEGYIQFGSGSNMPSIGGGGENHLNISNIPDYVSNAAAISAGLSTGDVYRLGDYLAIVH
jgi:hypothetical protein